MYRRISWLGLAVQLAMMASSIPSSIARAEPKCDVLKPPPGCNRGDGDCGKGFAFAHRNSLRRLAMRCLCSRQLHPRASCCG
jgi:hypothetical protein